MVVAGRRHEASVEYELLVSLRTGRVLPPPSQPAFLIDVDGEVLSLFKLSFFSILSPKPPADQREHSEALRTTLVGFMSEDFAQFLEGAAAALDPTIQRGLQTLSIDTIDRRFSPVVRQPPKEDDLRHLQNQRFFQPRSKKRDSHPPSS